MVTEIDLREGDRFLVSTETDGEVSMFLVDRAELLDIEDPHSHVIGMYEVGASGRIRPVTVHRDPTIHNGKWV